MPFAAVLFDLDGTLLNTLDDIASSANSALAEIGFPVHAAEAYKYFVGDGRGALAVRVLPEDRRDEATVARLIACIDREYNQHWADTTRPYDGVPELLRSLATRGTKMAVLSNKPDDYTRLMVSRLLPEWRFEAVVGARPSVPSKPDPAGALEIAGRLGVPPQQWVYVGDTDTDMKTARASGMFPAGALWGFRNEEELTASGARALLSHPTDLLALL
ncbi:MAG: HAD family hydrolase [Chloroflexi bacterium]|nr:HAD family hydrolase [Chloroflexota bacterium]